MFYKVLKDINRIKKETTANANGEGYDSSEATAATPTLTRRNRDAIVYDNSIHFEVETVNNDLFNNDKCKYICDPCRFHSHIAKLYV